jgi:hypothetical protein
MFLVTRGLPVVIEFGLLIYCLIDCIQTPDTSVRKLGKPWWILLILVFPLGGAIAWLIAGRPVAAPATTAGIASPPAETRSQVVAPPQDDPGYVEQMRQVNEEHERTLAKWEADLLRREQALRQGDDDRWREVPHPGPADPQDPPSA